MATPRQRRNADLAAIPIAGAGAGVSYGIGRKARNASRREAASADRVGSRLQGSSLGTAKLQRIAQGSHTARAASYAGKAKTLNRLGHVNAAGVGLLGAAAAYENHKLKKADMEVSKKEYGTLKITRRSKGERRKGRALNAGILGTTGAGLGALTMAEEGPRAALIGAGIGAASGTGLGAALPQPKDKAVVVYPKKGIKKMDADPFGVEEVAKAMIPRLKVGFGSGMKGALTGTGGAMRGGAFGVGQRAGKLTAHGAVGGLRAVKAFKGLSTGAKIGVGAGAVGAGGVGGYALGRKKN